MSRSDSAAEHADFVKVRCFLVAILTCLSGCCRTVRLGRYALIDGGQTVQKNARITPLSTHDPLDMLPGHLSGSSLPAPSRFLKSRAIPTKKAWGSLPAFCFCEGGELSRNVQDVVCLRLISQNAPRRAAPVHPPPAQGLPTFLGKGGARQKRKCLTKERWSR